VHELETENRRLSQQTESPLHGVSANSAEMLKVCRMIERIAPTDASVLLLGESGTGKELLGRSLHMLSPRAEARFTAINCAAIPENLLESELFGYEKGAFTGAAKQTPGKIEHANGGTLFLDEIGDLPMALQAKMLRFLEQRVVERIGGRQEIPVNVRVVCATHQDLAAKIRAGTFREDLYYRVSEITVLIPPLRERTGDVLLLARSFLEQSCRHEGGRRLSFSRGALTALERHSWPGNVRELKNRVTRAVIMAEGKQITAKDLELEEPSQTETSLNLREIREQVERQAIQRALSRTGGKISDAADLLGVSRPTLYDLIRKLGLQV
ncbi:MAG: sigma 54-interacting transcriptional regulator, partial [Acidobacteriaceae bacterium]